jgi:hypothetical protein
MALAPHKAEQKLFFVWSRLVWLRLLWCWSRTRRGATPNGPIVLHYCLLVHAVGLQTTKLSWDMSLKSFEFCVPVHGGQVSSWACWPSCDPWRLWQSTKRLVKEILATALVQKKNLIKIQIIRVIRFRLNPQPQPLRLQFDYFETLYRLS